jgi:hypothetical protein
MNHHANTFKENTLKKIYHGIYKFDLHSLKFYKNDINKKVLTVTRNQPIIEIITPKIIVPEDKILFKGENNLSTREMIKNIYNIDIIDNIDCSKNTHMLFFYRSLNYQINGDKVIIYFI